MSQHDLDIANQTSSSARADINSALKALGSTSSGSSAPSTTYANMLWYDTGSNTLKMRTEADDQWISIGYLDQGSDAFRIFDDTLVVSSSGSQTGLIGGQSNNTWQSGTGSTESLVSPAKVKASVIANAPTYSQPTSLGAVGTYALLVRSNSGSSISAGTTYAGSGLRYSGFRVGIGSFQEAFAAGNTGGTPSGTWRAMGTSNNNSGINPANIFLRIS
jgi:hypothetical protein